MALVAASLAGVLLSATAAMAATKRHAAMLLDANTGQILHNDDGDEPRYPASLTKMMTLYLTFETLQGGRLKMSDPVPISQEAASAAPSKLDLEPGETITVSDAIKALVTKSANDIAVALAEKVGGSEKNFVRLMNARARDLGMTKTRFTNPNGLPDTDQVTTARDMITLALSLQDHHPQYYPLFSTRVFTYGRKSMRNHNTLLNTMQGVDGIKTGYTRMSGFNLVSSVHRGGRHVVGAVFGGATAATRNAEMRTLLTRALTRASSTKSRKPSLQLIAKLKAAPTAAARPSKKIAPAAEARAEVAEVRQPPAATSIEPKPFAPLRDVSEPAPAEVERVLPDRAALGAAAAAATRESVAEAMKPPRVEVFKVKRVMVAPRLRPTTAPENPNETTDMPPARASDMAEAKPEPVKAPADAAKTAAAVATPAVAASAAPPTGQTFTVASAQPALSIADLLNRFASATAFAGHQDAAVPPPVPAASGPQHLAMLEPTHATAPISRLGAADVPPPPPALEPEPAAEVAVEALPAYASGLSGALPATMPTAAVAEAAVQRGVSSASLQTPTATAAKPTPAAPARFAVAAATADTKSAPRYQVQIGAYDSVAEAKRALSSVQGRATDVLATKRSVTQPVQKSGRTVYRARFAGFDAKGAANACSELRRQTIDCFVMVAE